MGRIIIFPHKKIFISGITFGPSIRFLQIAKALILKGHDVTIAEKGRERKQVIEKIEFIPYTQELLSVISKEYDIAIIDIWSNDRLFLHSFKNIPLVVDISTPIIAEHALFFVSSKKQFNTFTDDVIYPLTKIFSQGDIFLCANEQQRFYYMGILSLFGRINPYNYDNCPLIVLPTGLSSEEFKPKKGILKGSIIPPNKKIILWPGGIFSWFDAITPIKAMEILYKKYPQVAMVFVGSVNPRAPKSLTNKNFKKAYGKAKEMGLLNKNIFFIEWQPYEDRANIYIDAEFAVITSKPSVESELSHRTRILDCFWGGIPVIYDGNNELSKIIKDNSLGKIIPPNSPEELATAILNLIEDKDMLTRLKSNVKIFRKSNFKWGDIIKPLDKFCRNPKKNDRDIIFTPQHLLSERIDFLKEKEEIIRLLKKNLKEKNDAIQHQEMDFRKQKKSFDELLDKQKKSFENPIKEQHRVIQEQKKSFENTVKEQKESFEKIIEEQRLTIKEKQEILNKIFDSKAWKLIKLSDKIRGK